MRRNVVDDVVEVLLAEVYKEILEIKSNRRAISQLPGMVFTSDHTHHFLLELAEYIFQTIREPLLSKLAPINAFSYLRLYRCVESDEPDSLNETMVPSLVFYEFETQYEKLHLKIGV